MFVMNLLNFSYDKHVETNVVYGLVITRSSGIFKMGSKKQVYTRDFPEDARVFECENLKLTL